MLPLFIINLPYKPDRRERLTQHLLTTGLIREAAEIHWVRAISGTWCRPPAWWRSGSGSWGCLMSHLRIVQDAIMDGLENYMVLEDDAVFQPRAVEMLARVLGPGYDTAGSHNDRLSRVRQLRYTADASPAVQYLYAGLSWIVQADYPEPAMLMTHYDASTTADAGDPYTAIDRFGRLEEVRWQKTSGTLIENLLFGYDKADNRLWRDNPLPDAISPAPSPLPRMDELYAYDGLYQVTRRRRGALNNAHNDISSLQREENFTFDSLGNWTRYQLDTDGNGTQETDHTRTHNKSNQLTAITGTPSGLIAHDANGNMTKTVPDKDADWTKGYTCQWDAWNRLVEVRTSDTASTLVAQYQYDALFRRTIRTANGQTHHEYWDAAWRLIEERVSSATSAFSPYTLAFLWGLQRRNDLILRDRKDTSSGSGSDSGNSQFSIHNSEFTRHYLAYDWINPTAILSRNGTLLARQVFSAFGIRDLVRPDWTGFTTLPPSLTDWNFGFHGQFTDAETGWANYGFRYYSPGVGRWLSRDPIHEEGGRNLLAMVSNNAYNKVDFLGLRDPAIDEMTPIERSEYEARKRTLVEDRKKADFERRVGPNSNTRHEDKIRGGSLQYSCNCGWIDWRHLGMVGNIAKKLIKDLRREAEVNNGKTYFGVVTMMGSSHGFPVDRTIQHGLFVKRKLSEAELDRVGQEIVQKISEDFENYQSMGARLGLYDSSFSEEDLVSNAIGYESARRGLTEHQVRAMCDVISDVAENLLLYRRLGNKLGKNNKWTPVDRNAHCGPCAGKAMRFPEEFKLPAPEMKNWKGGMYRI